MCVEDVKKLHSSTVQCGKTNVYLFRSKFHKCMKCSLHMYPTSPRPPMSPKREIIYLSVYWFKDSITKRKESWEESFRQE